MQSQTQNDHAKSNAEIQIRELFTTILLLIQSNSENIDAILSVMEERDHVIHQLLDNAQHNENNLLYSLLNSLIDIERQALLPYRELVTTTRQSLIHINQAKQYIV